MTEQAVRILTVKASIRVPQLPNFLITESGESWPITALTEEGLRELGGEWVEELVRKAASMRMK